MKTKSKALSLIALGLLVVLGVSLYASGGWETLQGKFGVPVKLSTVTMALSSSSASGNRSAATSDEMITFDMNASAGTKTLAKGATFQVNISAPDLSSDADINTTSGNDVTVYLKDKAGATLGTGAVSVVNGSTANATITLDYMVVLYTTPATFYLQTDTTKVLDADPGEDDPVTVTVTYGTKSVTGNTVNY